MTSVMKQKTEKRRVLVVDDYPDAREMYGEYLEYCGFEVVQASNGMEALQAALDASPDIILMDLSLPVMDGWEATRRLKADKRTASIPVVALTGHALAGISEGAKKAGCDAFVTKPCLPGSREGNSESARQYVVGGHEKTAEREVCQNHRVAPGRAGGAAAPPS